jgi:hypothetical protein
MSRGTKQLLYGFFYFGVFVFVAWAFYGAFLAPAPSCFDGKLNQGEEGIDCGGPCIPCEILKLSPLQILREPKVLGLSSGKAVILTEVSNPNSDYGARQVAYRFLIYDKDGLLLEKIKGFTSFFPAETKIIYEGNFDVNYSRIARVTIEFDSPEWVSGKTILRPSLALRADPETVEEDGRIAVRGRIVNKGSIKAEAVKAIAIVFDRFSRDIFAVQTLVGDLNGFEEKDFVIVFPQDRVLNDVDRAATKVFLTSQ